MFAHFFGIDFCIDFRMPFFRFLTKKGRQKEPQRLAGLRLCRSQNAPKTDFGRHLDFSSIFHRFCLVLGTKFSDVFMFWACFFCRFLGQCPPIYASFSLSTVLLRWPILRASVANFCQRRALKRPSTNPAS